MRSPADAGPRGNPFASRWVRPGALDYLFPPGESAEALVARFESLGWRGQIVGPHGSGKSTLMATLLRVFERRGRCPRVYVLSAGQRHMPSEWNRPSGPHEQVVLMVDGAEQLGCLVRRRMLRTCDRRGWGVLWSTHRDLGLPTVYRTETNLPLAEAVVDRLLARWRAAGNAAVGTTSAMPSGAAPDVSCRVAPSAARDATGEATREVTGEATGEVTSEATLAASAAAGSHDEAIGTDDVERAFQSHAGDLREVLFELYDLFEQRASAVGHEPAKPSS